MALRHPVWECAVVLDLAAWGWRLGCTLKDFPNLTALCVVDENSLRHSVCQDEGKKNPSYNKYISRDARPVVEWLYLSARLSLVLSHLTSVNLGRVILWCRCTSSPVLLKVIFLLWLLIFLCLIFLFCQPSILGLLSNFNVYKWIYINIYIWCALVCDKELFSSLSFVWQSSLYQCCIVVKLFM